MEVRRVKLPDDAPALVRLDVAFTTNVILEVTSTGTSFQLAETAVSPPLRKAGGFDPYLPATDRIWTDGFVAVDGGRIIAFAATVYQRWNRRQVLWHLYVDAQHRGRGVGRRLVDVVIDLAREHGARQVWLETQNVNVPAVRAYQAMGFELVGLDRTLYDGEVAGETALYFARAL